MLDRKVWALLIVAYLMQDTSALKCWNCASDASNSQFCGENLDTKNITERQKLDSYVECIKPKNFHSFNSKGEEIEHRCEVYKQIINGVLDVYIRGCTLEPKSAPKNQCVSAYSDTSYVKTVECRTCSSFDGCNELLNGHEINASIGVKISKVVVVSLIVLTVLLI